MVIELVVGELVVSSAAFRSQTWLVGAQQIMQPCSKQGEFLRQVLRDSGNGVSGRLVALSTESW